MTLRATIVTLAVLAGAAPAAAQSANYKEAVDRYRSGRYAEALEMYAMLFAEIEPSVRQIKARVFDSSRRSVPDPVWVETALVLHTHAMAVGDHGGSAEVLTDLRDSVVRQAVDYTFIRCWYLFMSSRAQGLSGPLASFRIFDDAPRQVTEHPEAQLATAAAQETAWRLADEGRLDLPGFGAVFRALRVARSPTPSLDGAEAGYRAALAGAPDLHEARVRLGRVLTLQKRYDDALAVFAGLPADVEAGYRFLAGLFEGDARERMGDMDGAAAAYTRAIALMPHAESATLALAHLRHAQGRRVEALERTRALTSEQGDVGTDPWLWYRLGTAWRASGYLDAMQRIVTSGRRD